MSHYTKAINRMTKDTVKAMDKESAKWRKRPLTTEEREQRRIFNEDSTSLSKFMKLVAKIENDFAKLESSLNDFHTEQYRTQGKIVIAGLRDKLCKDVK